MKTLGRPPLLTLCFILLTVIAFSVKPSFSQTTAPSTRTADAAAEDLRQVVSEFRGTIRGGETLRTPESRTQAARQAIGEVHRILSLIDEVSTAAPDAAQQLEGAVIQYRAMGVIFDDPEVNGVVEKLAAGSGVESAHGKAIIAIADYVKAPDDAARNKALDAFDAALKLGSADAAILSLIPVADMASSPSEQVYGHLADIVKDYAQSPDAQQIAMQMEGQAKQMHLEGKPLVVAGAALDNPKFSTADWKGKVILVDFWATWCPPCLAELPGVKKMYADYHAKGFEVIGISSDNSVDDLKKFLAQNPDMPWPQIFDEKNPGWSPIATGYGIESLPAMYLIDRKGILRTVDASSQMEGLIPSLLAEKP